MRISNKLLLNDFVQRHSRAVKPMNKWVEEVLKAEWATHKDLKDTFPSADYEEIADMFLTLAGIILG